MAHKKCPACGMMNDTAISGNLCIRCDSPLSPTFLDKPGTAAPPTMPRPSEPERRLAAGPKETRRPVPTAPPRPKRCPGCGKLNDPAISGPTCVSCGRELSPSLDARPETAAPPTILPQSDPAPWSMAASKAREASEAPLKPPAPLFRMLPEWTQPPNDEGLTTEEREEKVVVVKEVKSVLYSLAGLQLVVGLLSLFVFPEVLFGGPVPPDTLKLMLFGVVLLTALFASFGLTAEARPFRAAMNGLVTVQ